MNGLYIAASGASAQIQALSVSAVNLANADTPGYRRLEIAIDAVKGHGSPYEYATAETRRPQIDLRQGPLRETGNPLDIAVAGDAFIRVRTPNGGEAYTRNGSLSIAPDGTLLAAEAEVLGRGGAPIKVPEGDIAIGGDGSVSSSGRIVGQISLADPAGAEILPAGESLYRTADGTALPEATEGANVVRNGYLERERGNAVIETVGIINAERAYESSMKVIQAINGTIERANQIYAIT